MNPLGGRGRGLYGVLVIIVNKLLYTNKSAYAQIIRRLVGAYQQIIKQMVCMNKANMLLNKWYVHHRHHRHEIANLDLGEFSQISYFCRH